MLIASLTFASTAVLLSTFVGIAIVTNRGARRFR